jgi:cyclophilin family peptidyl-prolyl cis-trans isomerase
MHVAQTWNPVWGNDMRETKVFGVRSMQIKRLATCFVVLFGLVTASVSAFAADPENTMIITLKDGDVTVALRPDLAPKHVEQIKKLVRQGAYDNVAFHRVIDGFMAQTGDVKFGNMKNGFSADAVGTGGSDLPDLPAEFSKTERYQRGVVGMARSQDPDSANSQFFIMFAPAPPLDGQYTIVGNVENGMELVDKIKKGDAAQNGVVTDPDRMIKVRIAADGK